MKIFGVAALLCICFTANATTLLFDGGFESGILQGWVPSNQGTAIVVRKGSCFSDKDTRKLSIRGQYAGLLRSPEYATDKNIAALTSKPFIAGSGLSFLALSQKGLDLVNPFALNISILDQQGNTLETRPLATARSSLSSGCPSKGSDMRFSRHLIDTRHYQGRTIKLRFSQHPDLAVQGRFTLIDDVSVLLSGETHSATSLPLAAASVIFDLNTKNRYLVAALPTGNIEQTRDWKYSWYIQGESMDRAYYKTCINSLSPGNYSATLHVRNANKVASDSLNFFIGETESLAADAEYCHVAHPLLERVSVPDPAT